MGINTYWLLTSFELDLMSKYLALVKDATEKLSADIEASYEEELNREFEDEWEWECLVDRYTDDAIDAGIALPQFALLSFVVMWYAFVEQNLLRVCERLRLVIPVGPRDTDRFGEGIDRARKFLIEGRKYKIDETHWQELVKIRRIRNVIIHQGKRPIQALYGADCYTPFKLQNGNTISVRLEENILSYIKKHNLYSDSPTFLEIMPPYEYCDHLVQFAQHLFYKLYKDLF